MFSGVLKKMQTEIEQEIQYYLDLPQHVLNMNQCVNKSLCLSLKGYECLNCQKTCCSIIKSIRACCKLV